MAGREQRPAKAKGRSPAQPTVPAPPGPSTEASPAAKLAMLLEAEADAARRADTATLLQLQTEKSQLLEALRASPPPPEVTAKLAVRADANLPMLRQLVALHRGLLGGEAPLYGPRGQRTPIAGAIGRVAESR